MTSKSGRGISSFAVGNDVFALASASTPVVFFFMWLVVLVLHQAPPSLSLGGQTTNRIFN